MPQTVSAILWIVSGIISLYLVFIFAPSLVGLLGMLARFDGNARSFDTPVKEYMTKYSGRIDEGRRYLLDTACEEVEIESRDGLRLKGYYFGRGSDKTVIFVHGYHATAMINFAYHGMEFHRRGYNVLMICQRAHCESEGRFTTMGIREADDVLLWTGCLRERGCSRIIVYGTSMGAATVGFASSDLDPACVKALVMDCGFTSPYAQIRRELKRRHLPSFAMMPAMVFLSKVIFRADIRKKVPGSLEHCVIPVCFIHGDRDETVSADETRANFERCASAKMYSEVKDAPHTAGFIEADEETREKIFDFIESSFLTQEKENTPS